MKGVNWILVFVMAIGMASPAWAFLMINNGSFEATAPNFNENIDGWDGTHDETTGSGNIYGVMSDDGTYAPETPYGDHWAFISYDDAYATSVPGWTNGYTTAIWTKIGTVEDNTDYTFSFLAGKSPVAVDYIDNDFDVSIWAGDASGPQTYLAFVIFSSPDGPGLTQEHTATLNSGTGHAGEDLYVMFSIFFGFGYGVRCQILIDNVQVEGGVEPGEFTVTETDANTVVSEEGPTSDAYEISMSTQPDANVTVDILDDPSGQVTVEPNQVTFTPADWSAKTITVTAVDDSEWDGDPHTVTIKHQVSTTGALYAFAVLPSVTVIIEENDPYCNPKKILTGDINADCVVNFVDFALMAAFWLDCSFENVPGCIEFPTVVTEVALWKLGDSDPGAIAGNPGNDPTEEDVQNLDAARIGDPVYSGDVCPLGGSLSMDFDGIDDAYCYYGTQLQSITDNFAVEAWIKPNAFVGAYAFIHGNNWDGFGLHVASDGGLDAYVCGVTGFAGSYTATLDEWQHVAIVRDDGTVTLYLNGVADPATTTEFRGIDPVFCIGFAESRGSPYGWFDGLIDEVRMFTFEGNFDPATDLNY